MSGRKSIFERLHDPSSYTGVYAARAASGGGINQDSDNAGIKSGRPTERNIHSISEITRPNLNPRRSVPPRSPRGRSRSKDPARKSSTPGSGTRRRPAKSAATPPPPPSQALVPSPMPPMDNSAKLQLVFQYYCKFGRTGARGEVQTTLDNFNFAKFTRECPSLLDSHTNSTEVDLIFTKCKTKGARRLTYSQFLDALALLSELKYPDEDPAIAFSLLLEHHVFGCPAAIGASIARSKYTGPVVSPVATSRGAAPPPPPRSPGHADSAAGAGGGRSVAEGFLHPAPPPRGESPVPELHEVDGVPMSYSARMLAIKARASSPRATEGHSTSPRTPSDRFRAADAAVGSHHRKHSSRDSMAALDASALVASPLAETFREAASSTALPPGVFSQPLKPDLPERKARASSPRGRRTSTRPERAEGFSRKPSRRPTVAGEANQPGSVYDRLSSPATFTGVYRRAYQSDGRINHFDSGISASPAEYKGHTNAGTDTVIHDMRSVLRPGLKDGPTFKV